MSYRKYAQRDAQAAAVARAGGPAAGERPSSVAPFEGGTGESEQTTRH
jgi:hypothetical protein